MSNLYKNNLLSTGLFINNEFLDKYVNLISNPDDNTLQQKHHIIPRYVYKLLNTKLNNNKENLVYLSLRNHIIAHYYLCLCSNTPKGRYSNELAVLRMLGDSDLDINDKNFIQNLTYYEDLYMESVELNRQAHLGKPSWNKGLHYSVGPMAQSRKDNISKSARGRYKNHIWIHKDSVNKHVSEDDLDKYLSEGFVVGRYQPSAYRKISEKQRLNPNRSMLGKKQSNYQKQVVSEMFKGKPKSEESCKKMSIAKLGKILVSNINTYDTRYINPQDLDTYLSNGYYKGRLPKVNK